LLFPFFTMSDSVEVSVEKFGEAKESWGGLLLCWGSNASVGAALGMMGLSRLVGVGAMVVWES
jgi:hypothetical protein